MRIEGRVACCEPCSRQVIDQCQRVSRAPDCRLKVQSAERGLREGYRQRRVKIAALPLKPLVLSKVNDNVKIT